MVSPQGRAPALDQPPHAFQILRRIHADGVRRRFDGADAEAVLEHAKLLEAFGLFERRRRQRGERAAGSRGGRRTGPGAARRAARAGRAGRTGSAARVK